MYSSTKCVSMFLTTYIPAYATDSKWPRRFQNAKRKALRKVPKALNAKLSTVSPALNHRF